MRHMLYILVIILIVYIRFVWNFGNSNDAVNRENLFPSGPLLISWQSFFSRNSGYDKQTKRRILLWNMSHFFISF